METMEVHGTSDGLMVKNGEHVLQCCSSRQKMRVLMPSSSIDDTLNEDTCLGQVYGVLGRLTLNTDGQKSYILLISRCSLVGQHSLKGCSVYRIDHVCAVPLFSTSTTEIPDPTTPHLQQSSFNFDPCPRHTADNALNFQRILPQKGKILPQNSPDSLKMSKEQVASNETMKMVESLEGVSISENLQNSLKSDQKLLDDILKLFNETNSFYFSKIDLTKRLELLQNDDSGVAADDRFFWNKFLLRDLIEQGGEEAQLWIIPVIQGFIEIKRLKFDEEQDGTQDVSDLSSNCEVMLISRRSTYRAGTRYIKRGIDKEGHCANFVETEQILSAAGHTLSFLQIRASIPIFWTQPGYKYRPPPILCKSKQENDAALKLHFDRLRSHYDKSTRSIIVVNLIGQAGREKILGDAFLEHVLDYDSDSVVYVAFDFHDHCRGLRFENVEVLVDSLAPELKSMRFSWLDKNGEFICRQNSIFRINCVDCLDRTNVAQAAVARRILDGQLRKLGLISPEQDLGLEAKRTLQSMWANTGDALSRQYAGTAALKGDFTRTGRRHLAGIVKDGYNSASRYYMCHLRDEQRQAAIDALLGLKGKTSKKRDDTQDVEDSNLSAGEKTERLRLLVADCEKLVVPEDEILLAGWPLVQATFSDADFLEPGQLEDEMDVVVMLTKNACYAAFYDDELDEFVDFQRILLKDISSIEMGPMVSSSSNIFKGQKLSKVPYVRVGYKVDGAGKQYSTWRSAGTRLFNNLALVVKTVEEYEEFTGYIFDQFLNALTLNQLDSKICINRFAKLDRKKAPGSPRSASKSPHKTRSPSTQPTLLNRSNAEGIISEQATSNPVGLMFQNTPPQIHVDQPSTKNVLIDTTILAPSFDRKSTVTQPTGQSATEKKISLSINLATGVPSSHHILPSPCLKNSKSENVLESLIANKYPTVTDNFLTATSSLKPDDDRLKIVKKSQSSANVKEKLIDGKRFLRSIGQQVKTFGSEGKAKLKDLARGGFKETTAGMVPEKGSNPQGNFKQYEDRIRESRTKFILL